MGKADQTELRREFWNLPDNAWASREMVAATFYQSIANFEAMAIHGGGPAYRRVGRRALYQKSEVD